MSLIWLFSPSYNRYFHQSQFDSQIQSISANMIQSFFYSIFHPLVQKRTKSQFVSHFLKIIFCLQFESSISHFMRLICTPRQKFNCNFATILSTIKSIVASYAVYNDNCIWIEYITVQFVWFIWCFFKLLFGKGWFGEI